MSLDTDKITAHPGESPAPAPAYRIPSIRRRGIWAVVADGPLMAAIVSTILFFAAIIACYRLPGVVHDNLDADTHILMAASAWYPSILMVAGLLFVLFMWFFWVYRRVSEEAGTRRIGLRNPLHYSNSTVDMERQPPEVSPWAITSQDRSNQAYRKLP